MYRLSLSAKRLAVLLIIICLSFSVCSPALAVPESDNDINYKELLDMLEDEIAELGRKVSDMSDDELRSIIRDISERAGFDLSENQIEALAKAARSAGEGAENISDKVDSASGFLKTVASFLESAKGIIAAIIELFSRAAAFVMGLFERFA